MLYQRTSAQRHNPEKSDRYIEENTSSLVKEEDTEGAVTDSAISNAEHRFGSFSPDGFHISTP